GSTSASVTRRRGSYTSRSVRRSEAWRYSWANALSREGMELFGARVTRPVGRRELDQDFTRDGRRRGGIERVELARRPLVQQPEDIRQRRTGIEVLDPCDGDGIPRPDLVPHQQRESVACRRQGLKHVLVRDGGRG